MRIEAKVIPNAKHEEVVHEDGKLRIRTSAPAVDGKANDAVLELVAKHFAVRRSKVKLLKGTHSRSKTFEITLKKDF